MSVEFQGILEKLEAIRLATIFPEISDKGKRECRKIKYNISLKNLIKSDKNTTYGKAQNRLSNEPGHEEMYLMPYANNKGADQPAHPRSLISALVVRCQDRMIPLVYISEILRF